MKNLMLLVVVTFCVSTVAAAQVPVIAVFPFSGEDADLRIRFTNAVTAEIIRSGKYTPAAVPFPADPAVSPALIYTDVTRADYALTGTTFYRGDESQYHLKLWLWNMETGDLVCSDEMVCRDNRDMARILPLLMEWIFSRIAAGEAGDSGFAEEPGAPPPLEPPVTAEPPEAAAVREPPPEKASPADDGDRDRWLYLGFRGGGSWRLYAEGDKSPFTDTVDQPSTWEGAFQASVRLLPFLALQGEAIFTRDRFSAGEAGISSYSVMFPLLLRFNIERDDLILSPLGGVYYILPVGDMEFTASGASSSFPWTHSMPLGYTLGLAAGIKLGPGNLIFDLRYSGDLSAAELDTAGGSKVYRRSLVSFTLGYEFGLFKRKR
ncbi:MAG: hypothetical protein LBS06_07870 [Treponema sp.]|jgi:hypothetical protein|nr:hypothetical protein [Treponema sp.]